jgi:hypothetical protein
VPPSVASNLRNAVFPGINRPIRLCFAIPRAPVRGPFQRFEKKLEKGVDGSEIARIMRGSLRDTVDFSGPQKDTCRRKRIVAKTSFACIMVGPLYYGDSDLNTASFFNNSIR